MRKLGFPKKARRRSQNQEKNLRKQAKMVKQKKDVGICWNRKEKGNNTTWGNKPESTGEKRKIKEISKKGKTGGRSLAEAKIRRGIFQGDALSPLLFIIAIMLLNLRKYTTWYKLSRSQEKMNPLMYMEDIKLFAKNEKELETLIHVVRIYSQEIGMKLALKNVLCL